MPGLSPTAAVEKFSQQTPGIRLALVHALAVKVPSRRLLRDRDFRLAVTMGGFRYWRDPVCLAACAAYGANRWLLKPLFAMGPFMRGHFNDLFLIPAALPLVLWLQRRLGWRTHDAQPTGWEIILHLAVWAFIAEGAGPWLTHHGTADRWDVVAYSVGAAACYVLWRRRELPCEQGLIPVSTDLDALGNTVRPLPCQSLARARSEPPAATV